MFRVTGSNIDNVEIIIFDRWDGTYKKSPCQQSDYFDMIKRKGKKTGNIKYQKGTVTLLR